MDAFPALITSFGDYLVTMIGAENLDQLTVDGHEDSGAAEVEIKLRDNRWDEQLRVIERIGEVRTIFMDELSFSYRFLSAKETGDVPATSHTAFSMA